MKSTKVWTDDQIKNYFMGIKYSDYPRIFWEKIFQQIASCSSLIDVGSGPGAFALKAAQSGMRVQAVDINKRNLDALSDISKKMSIKNITTIWGNWIDVKIKKADVCISAYSFANEIGTNEGISKILNYTKKIAFFITPYSKIQTDFASGDLYKELGEKPPEFSGDYSNLLRIFSQLGVHVDFESFEYDFGMPLENYNEDTIENCALYLSEKLQLNTSFDSLEIVKRHVRSIITIKNGMYWVPNPRKSIMITWRR